jgi:hypothetical protein
MVEDARLGTIMLLVTIATLATDVSRLLLEFSPLATFEKATWGPRWLDVDQETRQGSDAPGPDGPQQSVEPRTPLNARGPPHSNLRLRRPMFSPLPIDFSVNQPPWCLACRPH